MKKIKGPAQGAEISYSFLFSLEDPSISPRFDTPNPLKGMGFLAAP